MTTQIKSRLESVELTTRQSDAVRQRLSACLANDAQHITPGQKGEHVRAIQSALAAIGKLRPELGLPANQDPPGTFGPGTVKLVHQYKMQNHIVRPGQPLDDIVGRMTITQIDDDLLGDKPEPDPPPSPEVLGAGGIQIGPGHGREVVSYYTSCGLETIGPGQIKTAQIRTFQTLEELIDLLQRRAELHQVCVNHGDEKHGLLLPIATGGIRQMPRSVMDQLADLADLAATQPGKSDDIIVSEIAQDAGIPKAAVLRVVDKLVALRRRSPYIIHIRGCNVGRNPGYVASFKRAFGAMMVTAPKCRMTYQEIKMNWLKANMTMADLERLFPTREKLRHRVFNDPLGLIEPLWIAIEDLGHTHFRTAAEMPHDAPPEQALEWRTFLIGPWSGSSQAFVVPVLWEVEPQEYTYYCPLEISWREKLMHA